MMRAAIVLVLAILAPAFAADAPSPPEPQKSYVLISVENMVRLTDLIERLTDALAEQDAEIARLRRLLSRGGCA